MLGPDTHVHPQKRPGVTIRLADYGHFEGFVFVFDEPVRYRDGRTIRRLDLTGAMLDADWSPQEVIAALLHPLPDRVLQEIEAGDLDAYWTPVTRTVDFAYPDDSVPVVP